MSTRITLMGFVGNKPWDSFSEGDYAYRGGLRQACNDAAKLADHGIGYEHYTHIGVVVFGLDDTQPTRVIARYPRTGLHVGPRLPPVRGGDTVIAQNAD